jgi:hypothetical protein
MKVVIQGVKRTMQNNLLNYLEGAMGCTIDAAVRDVLTDLQHICTSQNIDFEERLETATDIYKINLRFSGGTEVGFVFLVKKLYSHDLRNIHSKGETKL